MSLAETAALLADRTRAAFCLALFDGRAWTAGELARHAGVSASTASEQLSRLIAGGLLVEERQGRHRYVRLSGPAAAQLIENLAAFSPDAAAPATLRESTRRGAEARARTCYDHLAGQLGVRVAAAALARGLVTEEAGLALTDPGRRWFAELGVDLSAPRGSRPLLRTCLDWTERRHHLAGAAGAALCTSALDRRWVERIGSGRALTVTPAGRTAFRDALGLDLTVD
ncbi:winged helix-turn-helix domain-containing protein [Kitasatospora sp. NBC_00070]|uniref:ArsR/SmtB family transcription factor n=1 Tax=Kitasatospora sp. NBC_00070 TaxID=2975962 RepID=UPI003252CC71